ncbi:hypothetical protein [Taklimakanibacter albus]|uniref:Uncharacterized protein n=1 Tax=Taklimakanibacter albus TaxID=2800327 RepID=A0ACC5R6P1_9HYPH|nr:hypothetical protein [Aestuariivirga sp. YIM B02566]MBK1868275.1 hypothetical protein [Aestuariivirga sp. YIM B02566]
MARLPVTDHAVLRYLERICGVDVAEVRRRIFTAAEPALDKAANGITAEGINYRIRRGRVITLHVGKAFPVRRQHAVAMKKIMRQARKVPIKKELSE